MELAHQAKAEPVEHSEAHPFGSAAESLARISAAALLVKVSAAKNSVG